MPKKYRVKLSETEREQLDDLTSRGKVKVRSYKRAQVLLLADETQTTSGQADEAISHQVKLSVVTIQRIRRRYVTEGLEAALYEKPRSGAPKTFASKQAAQITALACSEPPEGYARWSLRLLADTMVELEYVDQISYGTINRVLKKTNLSLTSNDNGALAS